MLKLNKKILIYKLYDALILSGLIKVQLKVINYLQN